MRRITDIRISLEAADVLEGQGIDPRRARAGLMDAAQGVLADLTDLLEPALVYDVFPVRSFRGKTIELEGGGTFEGPLAARALAGAEKVAPAVCTIGEALEQRVNELFSPDPVQAMALDGAGVAALREVSRVVNDEGCETASAHSWGTGMRAQPGQAGWLIWQQRVIFEHLPADEIGVRLNDSCLMIPRKSVSFAIGMGPHMQPDVVACDFCSKPKRCPWRVEA
jgi:hypothetical protein